MRIKSKISENRFITGTLIIIKAINKLSANLTS